MTISNDAFSKETIKFLKINLKLDEASIFQSAEYLLQFFSNDKTLDDIIKWDFPILLCEALHPGYKLSNKAVYNCLRSMCCNRRYFSGGHAVAVAQTCLRTAMFLMHEVSQVHDLHQVLCLLTHILYGYVYFHLTPERHFLVQLKNFLVSMTAKDSNNLKTRYLLAELFTALLELRSARFLEAELLCVVACALRCFKELVSSIKSNGQQPITAQMVTDSCELATRLSQFVKKENCRLGLDARKKVEVCEALSDLVRNVVVPHVMAIPMVQFEENPARVTSIIQCIVVQLETSHESDSLVINSTCGKLLNLVPTFLCVAHDKEDKRLEAISKRLLYDLLTCGFRPMLFDSKEYRQQLQSGVAALAPQSHLWLSALSDPLMQIATKLVILLFLFYQILVNGSTQDDDTYAAVSTFVTGLASPPCKIVVKSVWLILATAPQQGDGDSSLEVMKKLTHLLSEMGVCEVYTHHPALLRHAFTEPAMTFALQDDVLRLWLENDTEESEEVLMKLLKGNMRARIALLTLAKNGDTDVAAKADVLCRKLKSEQSRKLEADDVRRATSETSANSQITANSQKIEVLQGPAVEESHDRQETKPVQQEVRDDEKCQDADRHQNNGGEKIGSDDPDIAECDETVPIDDDDLFMEEDFIHQDQDGQDIDEWAEEDSEEEEEQGSPVTWDGDRYIQRLLQHERYVSEGGGFVDKDAEHIVPNSDSSYNLVDINSDPLSPENDDLNDSDELIKTLHSQAPICNVFDDEQGNFNLFDYVESSNIIANDNAVHKKQSGSQSMVKLEQRVQTLEIRNVKTTASGKNSGGPLKVFPSSTGINLNNEALADAETCRQLSFSPRELTANTPTSKFEDTSMSGKANENLAYSNDLSSRVGQVYSQSRRLYEAHEESQSSSQSLLPSQNVSNSFKDNLIHAEKLFVAPASSKTFHKSSQNLQNSSNTNLSAPQRLFVPFQNISNKTQRMPMLSGSFPSQSQIHHETPSQIMFAQSQSQNKMSPSIVQTDNALSRVEDRSNRIFLHAVKNPFQVSSNYSSANKAEVSTQTTTIETQIPNSSTRISRCMMQAVTPFRPLRKQLSFSEDRQSHISSPVSTAFPTVSHSENSAINEIAMQSVTVRPQLGRSQQQQSCTASQNMQNIIQGQPQWKNSSQIPIHDVINMQSSVPSKFSQPENATNLFSQKIANFPSASSLMHFTGVNEDNSQVPFKFTDAQNESHHLKKNCPQNIFLASQNQDTAKHFQEKATQWPFIEHQQSESSVDREIPDIARFPIPQTLNLSNQMGHLQSQSLFGFSQKPNTSTHLHQANICPTPVETTNLQSCQSCFAKDSCTKCVQNILPQGAFDPRNQYLENQRSRQCPSHREASSKIVHQTNCQHNKNFCNQIGQNRLPQHSLIPSQAQNINNSAQCRCPKTDQESQYMNKPHNACNSCYHTQCFPNQAAMSKCAPVPSCSCQFGQNTLQCSHAYSQNEPFPNKVNHKMAHGQCLHDTLQTQKSSYQLCQSMLSQSELVPPQTQNAVSNCQNATHYQIPLNSCRSVNQSNRPCRDHAQRPLGPNPNNKHQLKHCMGDGSLNNILNFHSQQVNSDEYTNRKSQKLVEKCKNGISSDFLMEIRKADSGFQSTCSTNGTGSLNDENSGTQGRQQIVTQNKNLETKKCTQSKTSETIAPTPELNAQKLNIKTNGVSRKKISCATVQNAPGEETCSKASTEQRESLPGSRFNETAMPLNKNDTQRKNQPKRIYPSIQSQPISNTLASKEGVCTNTSQPQTNISGMCEQRKLKALSSQARSCPNMSQFSDQGIQSHLPTNAAQLNKNNPIARQPELKQGNENILKVMQTNVNEMKNYANAKCRTISEVEKIQKLKSQENTSINFQCRNSHESHNVKTAKTALSDRVSSVNDKRDLKSQNIDHQRTTEDLTDSAPSALLMNGQRTFEPQKISSQVAQHAGANAKTATSLASCEKQGLNSPITVGIDDEEIIINSYIDEKITLSPLDFDKNGMNSARNAPDLFNIQEISPLVLAQDPHNIKLGNSVVLCEKQGQFIVPPAATGAHNAEQNQGQSSSACIGDQDEIMIEEITQVPLNVLNSKLSTTINHKELNQLIDLNSKCAYRSIYSESPKHQNSFSVNTSSQPIFGVNKILVDRKFVQMQLPFLKKRRPKIVRKREIAEMDKENLPPNLTQFTVSSGMQKVNHAAKKVCLNSEFVQKSSSNHEVLSRESETNAAFEKNKLDHVIIDTVAETIEEVVLNSALEFEEIQNAFELLPHQLMQVNASHCSRIGQSAPKPLQTFKTSQLLTDPHRLPSNGSQDSLRTSLSLLSTSEVMDDCQEDDDNLAISDIEKSDSTQYASRNAEFSQNYPIEFETQLNPVFDPQLVLHTLKELYPGPQDGDFPLMQMSSEDLNTPLTLNDSQSTATYLDNFNASLTSNGSIDNHISDSHSPSLVSISTEQNNQSTLTVSQHKRTSLPLTASKPFDQTSFHDSPSKTIDEGVLSYNVEKRETALALKVSSENYPQKVLPGPSQNDSTTAKNLANTVKIPVSGAHFSAPHNIHLVSNTYQNLTSQFDPQLLLNTLLYPNSQSVVNDSRDSDYQSTPNASELFTPLTLHDSQRTLIDWQDFNTQVLLPEISEIHAFSALDKHENGCQKIKTCFSPISIDTQLTQSEICDNDSPSLLDSFYKTNVANNKKFANAFHKEMRQELATDQTLMVNEMLKEKDKSGQIVKKSHDVVDGVEDSHKFVTNELIARHVNTENVTDLRGKNDSVDLFESEKRLSLEDDDITPDIHDPTNWLLKSGD